MAENSRKFVVFVDDSLISGSVMMMSEQGLGGVPFQPANRRQELSLRRSVLSNLAADLLQSPDSSSARVSGTAVGPMSAAVTGKADGEPGGAEIDLEKTGSQVLEGVGAIILDESETDIDSLRGIVGLSVFPDVEIALSQPEPMDDGGSEDFWHLNQVGAQAGTDEASDILVGVMDTGIDPEHPEFAGKVLHFAEFDSVGRLVSQTARDFGDHGTHVCSLVAGQRAGVASGAQLAVAAVLTRRNFRGQMTGQLIQIVNGFNWLITTAFRDDLPGVDVVNASLGGSGFNTYLQQAVRNSRRLGIPLIAAIGNAGRNGPDQHGSPANYPETLSVGASDRSDVVADFSDWGDGPLPAGPTYPVPKLSAPGVGIWAAKPGGGFQSMSGTSMATPIVTGIAANRMAADPVILGNPDALFVSLQSLLAPLTPHPMGNKGGAGRIFA